MDRPERTADKLREMAEILLNPGKTVKVETWVKSKDCTLVPSKEKQVQKGTVIALYPFCFTVLIGNHVESFRYNELLGREEVRVRV